MSAPDAEYVYAVTTAEHPHAWLECYLGRVTYENWCRMEIVRWKESGRELWIRRTKEGLIFLEAWRDERPLLCNGQQPYDNDGL